MDLTIQLSSNRAAPALQRALIENTVSDQACQQSFARLDTRGGGLRAKIGRQVGLQRADAPNWERSRSRGSLQFLFPSRSVALRSHESCIDSTLTNKY